MIIIYSSSSPDVTEQSSQNRELFGFDMKNFDWRTYFGTYIKGIRVYLLKDGLETQEEDDDVLSGSHAAEAAAHLRGRLRRFQSLHASHEMNR